MAIGSGGEAGTVFKSCKDYTLQDWAEWHQYMRDNWYPNLHAGWAKTVHKTKNNPYYEGKSND